MGLEGLIAKALRKTKYGRQATYPVFGILPSDFQEKLVQDIGVGKYVFFWSQLGFATGCFLARIAVKYISNEAIGENFDLRYFNFGIGMWNLLSILANSFRISYVSINRRPIGTLIFEGSYRLLKRSKKAERIIKEYVLR